METERVRLAKIEDAWDRNVHPAKEGRSIRSVMSVLPPIQKFDADRAATARSLDCVALRSSLSLLETLFLRVWRRRSSFDDQESI